MDGSFERRAQRSVNTFGHTAEQAKEQVVEFAKATIDQHINTVHARGKNPDNTWGIGLRGSGNYQENSYIPYLEVRNADSEPQMVELTNGYPVDQAQGQKISDHFFAKKKEVLGE